MSEEAIAAPAHDGWITARAIDFFENLVLNMSMSPGQPNYDYLVGEVAHAREEIAAERARRTA